MNRQQRRALDRRADRALDRVTGELITADITTDLVLVREFGRPEIIPAERLLRVLRALGIIDMHATVESMRRGYAAGLMPVLVVIEDYATVRSIHTHRLVRGGVA